MYIEFQLPRGEGGATASYALSRILKRLDEWAEKYNLKYKTKTIKHTVRVTFDSDEYYALFGLTWMIDSKYPSWTSYRMIIDLNNKT